MASRSSDVLILGGGHNGRVTALMLAHRNLKVTVLERREGVGGAAVTERPFKRAPKLGHSTGSSLLGLMPPGHIHHADDTPIDGLYFCGAGCHPAGSVCGAAGHTTARTVLEAMGLGSKA